jgi:3-oxoacyl-[acyl-carrier-protein] synthase II
MRRRVVITGVGCITPLGVSVRDVWRRMVEGESGAGPITLFDAHRLPVRIAAEVADWDVRRHVSHANGLNRHARQTQFAVAAAVQAARSAGLDGIGIDPTRVGVVTGCGEIFPDFAQFCDLTSSSLSDEGFSVPEFIRQARRVCRSDDELVLGPGSAAALIAGALDAQGPNANFTTACVSSSKAAGEAAEAIRAGDADIMLAGGAHSMIHAFGVTGFHRLSTLSTRNETPQQAARPFDRDRDGFVMGEGGVVFVLEGLDHALQRGADILGELRGWGCNHDAYRITDLDPEGRMAARCIKQALHDAQLAPEDIDYINAHGTGTVVNDRAETHAVKLALRHHANRIPISSTKSMTGHLTTACGAIEMFACLMAIRHNTLPPTINYEHFDPECDLDCVPNEAREVRCAHAMSNSFGFGGQNVVLVFSRYSG